MDVCCFIGADGLWALSDQRSGENLPAEHGPWTFLKTATLTGSDDEEREAEAMIREQGYCCFQDSAPG